MDRLKVRVKSTHYLAQDILGYEFESATDEALPAFQGGAHIDVFVAGIPVRSYSLYNDFNRSGHYQIAINRDENSRGGSIGYQDTLKAGQILEISEPRNHFQFHGQQQQVVFIAGGIGITPILSMISQMKHDHWKLYYYARAAGKCAFFNDLKQKYPTQIEILLNTDQNLKSLADIFQHYDADATEFYCCGPKSMIESFKALQDAYPYCYYESFVAEHEIASENSYQVELRKSQKKIQVVQGETLLDALLKNGCDVMHSCKEGICGACETSVLEGAVDHRDSILTDDEKQENKTMFPCCSSAKGQYLVLDL